MKAILMLAELIMWFVVIAGLSIGTLASISLIIALILGNLEIIKVTISVWGTVLLLPFLGFFLYLFRSRYRLHYGIAEFSVGFITVLNVFLPSRFDYSQLGPLAALQILGGLYIMVRGLDNVSQGIGGTFIEPKWRKVFGG